MDSIKPEIGEEYYFIKYNPELGLQGGEFNLDNYQVLKGRLIEVSGDGFLVQNDTLGNIRLKNTLLFSNHDEAEKYKFHLSF